MIRARNPDGAASSAQIRTIRTPVLTSGVPNTRLSCDRAELPIASQHTGQRGGRFHPKFLEKKLAVSAELTHSLGAVALTQMGLNQ
jgi:hypothetical protein